ncbi:A24 family peptidase [Dichotomicrobium thermohalophilum]|uniref:Prepilin peptidase CpaA n=1 Tax=Dichotomicrobium thermohalophilum TaxID=933063 RepID=A0A397Q5S1_9HYPH|nr:prepilin peptidase [Dichotomicrobium thermohalophilum]RIA56303.1 prepilin peptidase CpaA [Dichotomicrobium thermohalophilum]
MTDWAEPIIQGAFIFLVSYAMITDLRDLRVPNWVPLAIAGLFLLYSLDQGGGDLPVHMLTGVGMLVVAFALFVAGVFGGGDAKFIAALALWMGPADLGPFVLITTLLGGAMAVALVGLKKLLVFNPALENHAAIARPLAWARTGKMPYAVPIGLAALMLGPALF